MSSKYSHNQITVRNVLNHLSPGLKYAHEYEQPGVRSWCAHCWLAKESGLLLSGSYRFSHLLGSLLSLSPVTVKLLACGAQFAHEQVAHLWCTFTPLWSRGRAALPLMEIRSYLWLHFNPLWNVPLVDQPGSNIHTYLMLSVWWWATRL